MTKAVTKGALSEASDIRPQSAEWLPATAWRSQGRSASRWQDDLGWTAGSTYRVAQRLSAAFAARTDTIPAVFLDDNSQAKDINDPRRRLLFNKQQ